MWNQNNEDHVFGIQERSCESAIIIFIPGYQICKITINSLWDSNTLISIYSQYILYITTLHYCCHGSCAPPPRHAEGSGSQNNLSGTNNWIFPEKWAPVGLPRDQASLCPTALLSTSGRQWKGPFIHLSKHNPNVDNNYSWIYMNIHLKDELYKEFWFLKEDMLFN